MKRKLVQQGAGTMMISLPSKWIKEHLLKKGDEIDMVMQSGNLLISKGSLNEKRIAEINLSGYAESSIRTLITNVYRSGYDGMRITFKDEKQFKIVNATLNHYLLGFEVMKKDEKKCLIENITEPAFDQFEVIMEKIIYNVGLLITSTKEKLQGKNPSMDYEDIVFKIYQYDNFCRRVIARKEQGSIKNQLYWTFQTLLIHGQRELYHLHKSIEGKKYIASPSILALLDDTDAMYGLIKNGYLKKDISLLEKMHEDEKEIIYTKGYAALAKAKSNEAIVIYHLLSAARNFYLASSPLMGLLIENHKQP
jgi:hypothetical protein